MASYETAAKWVRATFGDTDESFQCDICHETIGHAVDRCVVFDSRHPTAQTYCGRCWLTLLYMALDGLKKRRRAP